MDVTHIDRFVELLKVAIGISTKTPPGVQRAFSGILDGPKRMSYLSAAQVHDCVPQLLPCWLSWRSDPALRSKLRRIAAEDYHTQSRMEILIFIAEPNDAELEELFCEAVKKFWDGEQQSIRAYVNESCGGSQAHFDDEMAGAHASLFPLLIQFATFGYTKQFTVIPKIPSHIGRTMGRYQPLIEPILRGSETMRIALEHLLPEHILPQSAPERRVQADDPIALQFLATPAPLAQEPAKPKSQKSAPQAPEAKTPEQLYQELLDAGNARTRRSLIEKLGPTILEPRFRGIVPILLRDEDKYVAQDTAEIYLSEYARKAGPLEGINHGIALSFQVPFPEVFATTIYRLVEEYGHSC